MSRKVYYLSTCDTCKRILHELGIVVGPVGKGFELQDIKTEPITEEQLDEMGGLAGSFEALFSRVARKYRSMGLKDQKLEEADYRRLILEEYTFLKRPVFVINEKIFVGNSKKNVEAVRGEVG